MTIFNDLNATARCATLIAVIVCALIAVVEVRRWRKPQGRGVWFRRILLLFGACACAMLGLDTLSASSDAQHASVTGELKAVGSTHAGRGTAVSQYLVCVNDCQPAKASLVMDPAAQLAIKAHKNLSAFTVGYLMDKERASADTLAYKVVDVSDPVTGTSFYHLDTAPHPMRAGLFFADAALFLLTALLGIRR